MVDPGPELLVQPAARTVRAASTISSPIGTVGRHPSRRPGEGTQLSGLRPYRAGDRAARINWRATSRTGALHTNQTLLERDTQIQLILDTSFIGGAPTGPDTVEMGCEAVTTLAHHYAWLGDRVAVIDIAGRIPTIPFGTGRDQTRRILDALSRLDRSRRGTSLVRMPRLRPGTLAILCSPVLTREALRTIAALRLSGCELAIVDTLPGNLSSSTDSLSTALRLRALQRTDEFRRLRHEGIPIAPWRGASSLVPLLRTLAASRGPRRSPR